MKFAQRKQVINDISGSFSPMRIIDIGCGACTVADIFERNGHTVTVTDSNPARIPVRWKSRFRKAPAQSVSIEGFQGIILAGLLYHLSTKSQLSICGRLSQNLVFLDTHYVQSDSVGSPRKRTASSEPLPVVPSLGFIRNSLFPKHRLFQADPHAKDRSWFVCVPCDLKLTIKGH